MKKILVTGGAGFIGSNFINKMAKKYPDDVFINLDKLTYAGNLKNLKEVESLKNYIFCKVDICNYEAVESIFRKYEITDVIHFAAESHVDRSILGPKSFIETNFLGTFNLIDISKNYWAEKQCLEASRFHHISTDEVYGSLGKTGLFTESTAYQPNSPYSASKAGSDHIVRAYHHTYGLNTVTTNCSNNYGPYQFPEKLIPLMFFNARNQKELPIYGDGKNVRDWLYVEDHCDAIDLVFRKGKNGEVYNIGGHNEKENIYIVDLICSYIDTTFKPDISAKKLIKFVKDRLGHDRRYAIDASKIEKELGWVPQYKFEEGIQETLDWYKDHDEWVRSVLDGSYQSYYETNYANR
jgi:dTDP-glucose 4,6-dehydratase